MLDALKRLIAGKSPSPEWPAVAGWAQRNKLRFRRTRDDAGFVIEGGTEGHPWRLEWGPPQRSYIQGHELRMRMEASLPLEWQVMVLSMPLLEQLERQTFERYTESTQTVIDVDTPEEMRWLAMYTRVPCPGDRGLRSRFGLVGNLEPVAQAWVHGDLSQRLADASATALQSQPPFVLMMMRGRVYLRTQLPEPDVQVMAGLVPLFESAVSNALRVAHAVGVDSDREGWASTASTAWQTQLGPEDPKARDPR